MTESPATASRVSAAEALLLASVFLIAACGLVYELAAGALASYLLGDSVLQFSTVIGTYLFAMGIGSWLSRFVGRGLVARFILVEIMVGVVGGFSSAETSQLSPTRAACRGPDPAAAAARERSMRLPSDDHSCRVIASAPRSTVMSSVPRTSTACGCGPS